MVKKVSMEDLIRKNKEELLKDKTQMDRIEKRIDQKYLSQSKQTGGDK
ncbi:MULTISPECIES: FbpB family small basic protein [Bacillaceae]|uniref:FbpB family small basic protein n=1 Tax=Metabacillus endolithicus TaxID=1535204 RepID=A0ABW5C1U0_9BACI|nr:MULTISPECIES: FbpB family small basic protein [Bacillaceae]PGT81369.1 FbpB family small basic protein [Bacillus sp. AFS040349]UGB30002.1 FbpB family small basic protein [Metabacillus sp. B2-18]UPG64969.1 FbpB family small basic protein [Metabacillus endolithicus]